MTRPEASSHLRWWVYAVVFAASLVGFLRRHGISPVVHPDTAFEMGLAAECLRGEGCTTLGGSASFSGIFHMVGWLNFMVLAQWLGLGRDEIHLLIQVLNAAGIVLVMLVAGRLGGAPAAALAPYFALSSGAAPGALYDTSLMAFFGTVLLVQCVAAAAARPPTWFLVLAALVAAVIAEIHLAGSLALVSVGWAALLHPHHRLRRVLAVVVAFALAVLIVSPMGIVWDFGQVLSRFGAQPSPSGWSGDPLPLRLSHAADALSFLVPWGLYRLGRSTFGDSPAGLAGAMAICVPVAAAYVAGVTLGVIPVTSLHYFEHTYPAEAVAVAVPLMAIAASVWQRVAARLAMPAVIRAAAPWVVALVVSLHAIWQIPAPERIQPRWNDLEALAGLLRDEWQWDWATVEREVRAPEKALLLAELLAAAPDLETAALTPRHPPEPTALLAVETRRAPDPLPGGWRTVSRTGSQSLLAVPLRSALRWTDQTICVEDREGAASCVDPASDPDQVAALRARVPVIRRWVRRVRWDGPPGAIETIAMPRIPLTCHGRIVQGPPGTILDADGRRARISTPGEVVFEWLPNTQSCPPWDLLKLDDPPFVIAGHPATVDLLTPLVEAEPR